MTCGLIINDFYFIGIDTISFIRINDIFTTTSSSIIINAIFTIFFISIIIVIILFRY